MTMQVTERRLDLRDFQDIVDEAKKLIPRYCPEWTDHNVSDPGVTLIELFAWMTEMILYQLNRMPDEMHERFLDMVGVQRLPPIPSAAHVTFYLSGPLTRPVTIDAETEVATDRTEVQEAIVFATTQPVTLAQPSLAGLRAWREGQGFEDYLPYVTSGLVEAPLFNDPPVEGDAIYIGFEGNLHGRSLAMQLECEELEGVHIDPRDAPLSWEYWSAELSDWKQLRLLDQSGLGRPREATAVDPTYGLNRSAEVYLHVPIDSRPQMIDGIDGTWVRIRYLEKPGQGYTTSPRLRGIRTEVVGATVEVRQAQLVKDESLGRSDGSPGQSFSLTLLPILRRRQPHRIEAELDGEITEWSEVSDFSESGESDRHFMIHYPTGQVRFGPSIRARDGTQRQHGAVPRKDADLRLSSYHSGGGTAGNVGEGTITQLKTSIPYIAAVTNYLPSRGGLNEETLDEAKLRALSVLKRPVTAVTREDYERLALEVEGVGQARCITPEMGGAAAPGTVRLLLLPQLPEPRIELTPELMVPPPQLLQAVSAAVEERKCLGTVVELAPVAVQWAEIDAHVFVKRGVDVEQAQNEAVRRLRTLLHPVRGGLEGRGLSFGGAITVSQIAGTLQSLPGVVYIERVRLRRQGNPEEVTRLQPAVDSLLALGHCYVLAETLED